MYQIDVHQPLTVVLGYERTLIIKTSFRIKKALSIKIGKYFDSSRVYTSFSYQNKKDDFSSWTLGLGYDYLIKNSSSITPFIGANISYIQGNVDEMPVLDKPAGFAAGIEAGFIYSLSSNTELEAGIRYMNISNVEDSATISGVSVKLEGKSTTQYYLVSSEVQF